MTLTEAARGLRILADLLEANPKMVVPHECADPGGPRIGITFYCHTKESFLGSLGAFGPGKVTEDNDSYDFRPFDFPLAVRVVGFKNQTKTIQVPMADSEVIAKLQQINYLASLEETEGVTEEQAQRNQTIAAENDEWNVQLAQEPPDYRSFADPTFAASVVSDGDF